MTLPIAAVLLWALHQPTTQPAAVADEALETAIACGPGVLPAAPVTALRVIGGETHGQRLFRPGDPLIINAGAAEGIKAGQEYFVRRTVHSQLSFSNAGFTLVAIHTAGWITVVDPREHVSIATVTHACDGIIEGDFLEPYAQPALPTTSVGGAPDFGHPARILMADEQRQAGFEGMLMLIDRGSDQGVRAGQAVTIFRTTLDGHGPTVNVGVATVLQTSPATALVRIDSSGGPIYVGDLAAIHRIQ